MAYLENKKARFDYKILETFEAGMHLLGFEVKSIRAGKISIAGSYIKIYGKKVYLVGSNIQPYQEKNIHSEYDPERSIELLLHKKEMKYLMGKLNEKGLTLIPLKLYNKNRKIKIEIALVKSKKKMDKREYIKKRDVKRDIDRKLKNN